MRWIRIGAALAFVAVACGAFGAHGLEERLSADLLEIWHTAVQYHAMHAVGLLILGVAEARLRPRRARAVGVCFLVGIGLFSGSLYLLALTGMRWLGAVTPFGGVAFLVGWALLAFGRPRAEARGPSDAGRSG